MNFKKWLYRKEIEQLKEDLYLFKMRFEFDERSFAYTTELEEIKKYLESILINKAELSPSKLWDLTHFEWVKMNEEEFNSYYDVTLCPEETRYSFEELKDKFNRLTEEKKSCLNLGSDIRTASLEMIKKKKSTFYKTFITKTGDSFCFGITDDISYPVDPNTYELSMIKWDAIIKGIEGSLLAFGCSKEEIEAV